MPWSASIFFTHWKFFIYHRMSLDFRIRPHLQNLREIQFQIYKFWLRESRNSFPTMSWHAWRIHLFLSLTSNENLWNAQFHIIFLYISLSFSILFPIIFVHHCNIITTNISEMSSAWSLMAEHFSPTASETLMMNIRFSEWKSTHHFAPSFNYDKKKKKSIVGEAEIPFFPLTAASIDGKEIQARDFASWLRATALTFSPSFCYHRCSLHLHM